MNQKMNYQEEKCEEFYILMRILSFKCLLDSWKAKIEVGLG